MTTKILIGDALEQLAGLADESVQCCVTSPPYYGLRDYGTAEWEGGDPGCDHLCSTGTQGETGQRADRTFTARVPFKGKCGKCGATRTDGQIGLEETPEAHIAALVEVFREVRRVLRKDGVCFVNYGDAYCSQGGYRDYGSSDGATGRAYNSGFRPGSGRADGVVDERAQRNRNGTTAPGAKPKDLLMMPSRVALALQADGWWLRSMIPWLKRSAMPESATDRPATAVEYVFMLTKSARYFYDAEAVRMASDMTEASRKRAAYGRYKAGNGKGGADLVKTDFLTVPGNDFGSGRNFRNADLFFSSLREPHGLISDAEGAPLALDVNPAGFAEAHFATFPPKLIEPLIKAATSEKGCCATCGAPWVREVETERVKDQNRHTGRAAQGCDDRGDGDWPRMLASTKTLGWSRSCGCKTRLAVPCTVLDPFGGAGTTGLVADRLGRSAILIELNPDYAEMARKRISGDSPLFAEVQT